MKGARALAGGIVVLVLVCALPAASAAQDAGSAGGSATTTTTTTDPSTPPAPEPAAPTDSAPSPSIGAADTGGNGGGGQGSADQPAPTDTGLSQGGHHPSLAHKASTVTVRMGDFFFAASSVTIHVGDIVTWRNTGNAPHTATANDGSFDTGTVTSGQSASHMFTSPGTFSYVCTIHPNMHGTIHVLAASGSGGGGGSGSGASSSSSGPSEAQAVQSPNAPASSSHLAATGMAVGALALAGLVLLAGGLAVRYVSRPVPTPDALPAGPSQEPSSPPAPGAAPLLLALLLRRRSGTLVLLLALLPVGLRLLGRRR